ncbi:MAG: xylulokinase [Anaerolineae bacterium]
MASILGIDIGTSSVKAIVYDTETHTVLAVANQEYPIYNPQPGYAEQHPDDWWQAVIQVTRRVVAATSQPVAAIGLTGQMHGTVLLDAAHKPLHPAIIWADQRSASVIPSMIEAVGAARYASIAGTLPAAGFMGPTLVWLQQHQPHILDEARHVLLPKDEVRLRLTGQLATEVSDAASTGIFDISHQHWSEEIIKTVGIPTHILPHILDSTTIAGELTTSSAAALSLTPGIPVVAGCADQPAQAIANGLVSMGRASVTIGTGGQVFVPLMREANMSRIPTDPRLHVFNHAVPGMWYILGAILSAGLSLRWLRDLVGLRDTRDAYERLSAEAAEVPPGADGLVFLPYLVGERTPHMDPLARGAFVGLSYHHTRGHMARAVMEGVTFALRQTLEISLSMSQPVEQVIAAGGGAESALWRQIQADIYGLPLQRSVVQEQTCIGAALLAAVGTGAVDDFNTANGAGSGELIEPNTQNTPVYTSLYAQFLDLYPRLTENFHTLSKMTIS